VVEENSSCTLCKRNKELGFQNNYRQKNACFIKEKIRQHKGEILELEEIYEKCFFGDLEKREEK
jgi:hypothetical protein